MSEIRDCVAVFSFQICWIYLKLIRDWGLLSQRIDLEFEIAIYKNKIKTMFLLVVWSNYNIMRYWFLRCVSILLKLWHWILVWGVKIAASDIGLKLWFLVCAWSIWLHCVLLVFQESLVVKIAVSDSGLKC